MGGRVFSLNIGKVKGEPKEMAKRVFLKEGFGLEGDVHAGPGARQVSLLGIEEIEAIERSSAAADIDFRPGLFAENITTQGIDLARLKVGDTLRIGEEAVLKVTQIGKECHNGCAIFKKIGACAMPKRGIFASVETGGEVKVYDRIRPQRQRSLLPWSRI